MKAIVTGSNGFIGFNLCQKLKQLDWEVVGLDDLSSGSAENVVQGFRYEIKKIQDRKNTQSVISNFEPDVIFHLAAIPRVAYSVENPYKTAEANVLGTISILEGVVKAERIGKTRVVNTSSSSVYGNIDTFPTPEQHPCSPLSPYALEKFQSEQWCSIFARIYGLDIVSLRYFNVFGPHSLFGGAYSTVLSAWLYHLYVDSSYQPFLEDDGRQTRDFCFVDNVIQANILAAQKSEEFQGEVYNIAQGKSHSLLQVKDILEQKTGKTLHLEERPRRIGDVKHTLADISGATNELGYQPTINFEEQIAVMAEWYKTSYPSS